jgi:acylpyruvate hydrolase
MLRLVTFEIATPIGPVQRLGSVLDDRKLVDLRAAYACHLREVDDPQHRAIAAVRIPDQMIGLVRGGAPALAAAKAAVAYAQERLGGGMSRTVDAEHGQLVFDPAEVRFLPPLVPGKMVCVGRNYPKHQAESAMPAADDFPRGFIKVSSTLVGHEQDILYPAATRELDYEVELAVVMGKAGLNVPVEAAYEHVFGYTILNDVSGRDLQFEERKKGNHLLGKNLDDTGPLGPWIVPKEFVPEPMNLRLTMRVNGKTRQDSNSGYMIYDIPHLIAHFSKMTLEPGDLLSTGSPEGVASGHGDEAEAFFLKPGDRIEAEVEGLGVLANRIVEA